MSNIYSVIKTNVNDLRLALYKVLGSSLHIVTMSPSMAKKSIEIHRYKALVEKTKRNLFTYFNSLGNHLSLEKDKADWWISTFYPEYVFHSVFQDLSVFKKVS